MRVIAGIRTLAARYLGDRHGHFGLVTAVTAPMLMLAAGYGLNVTQMVMTRSSLLSALDSAVTSTARDLTTGAIEEKDAREVVEAFLFANGERGFSDAKRITLDNLFIDRARGAVVAEASVVIDIAFPVFGIADTQRVSVESAALYSDKKIEVAMMLDVTGSMAGDKIEDLRGAATNAVELLLGSQKGRDPRVRVALIPYAEAVNVGALAEDTVFIERAGRSDLPPPIAAGEREIRRNTGKWEDNCATERKLANGSADPSDESPFSRRRNKDGEEYLAKVNRDDRLEVCPSASVVPLTADLDRLVDEIEDFRAAGVTAGNIGVQWSYYMLSQEWRGAIRDAGLGDGPANADRDEVAKIAILMTDGLFNTAFAGVDEDETPQMYQVRKSGSYAKALCERMKDDGIEIFTIGFALDDEGSGQGRRAREVLENCASEDTSSIRHFYEASTGDALDSAYRSIIANMERLYLTM